MTLSKLRWRCRRGTRELDVVLQRFLDETYPHLDQAEQDAFASLLEQQDPDLAAWILSGKAPPERWRGVVARIRKQIDAVGS
ncbi:MAG TPA: succinate dehydrogenase assembly factor 2 [Arenicellales bacterium]|nr:succinate dehydrogenase assembly factor 2 [Arenicellales bacterium]